MSTTDVPGLSQVKAWTPDHLEQSAAHWTDAARTWDDAYSKVFREVQAPGGVAWEGVAGEAATQRVGTDRVQVVGASESLHSAAEAARTGAGELATARSALLEAVRAAETAAFTVAEDYSVSSQRAVPAMLQASVQAQARGFAAIIGERLSTLSAVDSEVASKITAASAELGAAGFEDTASSSEDDPTIQLVDNRFIVPPPDPNQPLPPAPPGKEWHYYTNWGWRLEDPLQDCDGEKEFWLIAGIGAGLAGMVFGGPLGIVGGIAGAGAAMNELTNCKSPGA